MSKYAPLWKWINKNKTYDFKLTFAEIENIAGVPIDHSFLTFKKELLKYGFKVAKTSIKEQTVDFECRSQSDCVHEQVAKADCECPRHRAVFCVVRIPWYFYVRVYSGYYAGYGNSRLLFRT